MAFSLIKHCCLPGLKSLNLSYWFSSEPLVRDVYFLNDEILAINNVTINVKMSLVSSVNFVYIHILSNGRRFTRSNHFYSINGQWHKRH